MFPATLVERVGEELMSNMEKTDDDGVVQIYSYKECGIDSPAALKECRGLVYAGERLVLRSFGFTPEYNETQLDTVDADVSSYTFFPAEEGTLIRVFYVRENSKWYVSTHRKLDAFKSRWSSSRSFGDLFVDALHDQVFPSVDRADVLAHLTGMLDDSSAYFFLLRNTAENRIVCHPPASNTSALLHIGTLKPTDEFDMISVVHHGFHKAAPLNFDSWADVRSHVLSLNPLQQQGVIGFTRTGAEIKIVHSKNQEYAAVRGNESNILYRYLRLRTQSDKVLALSELYPERIGEFAQAEAALFRLAMQLHQVYMARFVMKQYVKVPKEEFRILKACHAYYLEDRANRRVTPAVVSKFIADEGMVSTIFALLKRSTTVDTATSE